MIDNIVLLVTGTMHQRPLSELIPKCHPLGSFEQMEAIHVASTPSELYNAVLVDTPLGEYLGCGNPLDTGFDRLLLNKFYMWIPTASINFKHTLC